MKNYDIEAYSNGELTGKDLEDFEQELSQNPAFRQEVEIHRQLMGDLQMQLLREQVSAAISSTAPADGKPITDSSAKQAPSNGWRYLLPLLLVLPVTWFFFFRTTPPVEEPSDFNQPVEVKEEVPKPQPEIFNNENTEPGILETSPEKDKSKESSPSKPSKPSPPIAQGDQSKVLAPAPPDTYVRGENWSNEEWETFLSSIWYTDFPPAGVQFTKPFKGVSSLLEKQDFTMAYVLLQPLEREYASNDTLAFLKGYCLTELREGEEALRYFDQIKAIPASWQASLDWYRGLDFLMAGERDKAIHLFEKIASSEEHFFKVQAANALKRLR